MRFFLFSSFLCLSNLVGAEKLADQQWDFLSNYCLDCHDEEIKKGDINLDVDLIEWSNPKVRDHWSDVYTMLERGKMPPKKKKSQPSSKERKEFMTWLDQKLMKKSVIGGTPIRRLNSREYEETIKEVFGLKNYQLPHSFPRDFSHHGFDTLAEDLVVSPSHFEAYSQSATEIADYFFPPVRSFPKKQNWNILPTDLTISYSSSYIMNGAMRLASKGGRTRNGTWPTKFEAIASGTYRVDLKLSTFNPPKGELPQVELRAHKNKAGSERSLGIFELKSETPEVFQKEVTLYKGENLLFFYKNAPYGYENKDTFKETMRQIFSEDPKLAAAWDSVDKVARGGIGWARVKEAFKNPNLDASKYKRGTKEFEELMKKVSKSPVSTGETLVYKYFEEGPNVGIHQVDVSGPLKAVVDPEVMNQQKVSLAFLGDYKKSDDTSLNKFMDRYLTKAFRRKVSIDEVNGYVELVHKELVKGERIEEGLHLAIRTSLTSPSFLYREKGSGPLTQNELASRLSYFLTSGPPDEKLTYDGMNSKLNEEGKLSEHTKRLIKSFKNKKFIHDFTSQWLDTDVIDTIMPDRTVFKGFKGSHINTMKDEVETNFYEVLNKNLSVMEFIDPDFIYTNKELGEKIYELKNAPKQAKLKKVQIERGTKKGGILTMPAVMMATANGVDTQPVLRGVWMLENILGTPPPAPPKNVPALPPDTADAVGPRAKLAAHMKSESCSSCHEDIDPMGFVFENLSPVGKWRDFYPTKSKAQKPMAINASATMPNGTKLNDIRDLKRYLVENPDVFTNCLAEKIMSYATGREINYREKEILKSIVEDNIENGNKFYDLVLSLVNSEVFKAR